MDKHTFTLRLYAFRLRVGNQPRWRLSDLHCWTSGDELFYVLLAMTVVNTEVFGKFGVSYRPEFSCSELCATHDGASA
jgi:hypothetical protein